jgi:type III secretion protein C
MPRRAAFQTPVAPTPRPFRLLIAAALLAGGLQLHAPAAAAPMPQAQQTVSITAREQPIEAFLQELFGQMDLPVDVAPGVHGQVSGSFNGPAQRVLRDVSRSFGLLTYFDGAVVHVYAAGDVTSRTFPTTPPLATRVRRAAQEAGLGDEHNTLRITRDGSVIATGTRRFIEQVDDLVRATQSAAGAAPALGFKVFYLRYAWAQDVTVSFGGRQVVVPGVASILRSLVTSRGRAPLAAGERLARPTSEKLRGQGLARIGNNADARRLGTLGADEGGNNGANAADGVAQALLSAYGGNGTLGDDGSPMLRLGTPDQVRIEVDQRLNAVIVRDAPQRMSQYEQLIAALDVEPQSLEIEATIIDVNTDKLRELGINWRWANARNAILFGRGDESDLRLRPNTDVTPSGRGGFVSAVLGDASQFVARINALQADGAARVVSSPQVLTLSNVEAVFDNSQTFYVRVPGYQDVDLFNVSAGTNLRVTPHVFKDHDQVRIKLLVNIEDGSITSRTVDNLPVVERSAVNTQALIQEGESLLIGGLVRESSGSSVDKVPVLGDIPVVGNLFKTRSDNQGRVERMFLITPRLASAARSTALAQAARNGTPIQTHPVAPPPPPAPASQPEHIWPTGDR